MSKSKTTTKKSKKKKASSGDPDLVPLNEAMGKKSKKAAKQTKEPKEKKLSCLDAAAQVLKEAGTPMNTKAMIDAMETGKLWHSNAPTPAATLYSAILREMQTKKAEARFKKVDRGQFALKD